MTRVELEKNLGKLVEIVLFDGKIVEGYLQKTGSEKIKNNLNLFIPKNYYFMTAESESKICVSHLFKVWTELYNKFKEIMVSVYETCLEFAKNISNMMVRRSRKSKYIKFTQYNTQENNKIIGSNIYFKNQHITSYKRNHLKKLRMQKSRPKIIGYEVVTLTHNHIEVKPILK